MMGFLLLGRFSLLCFALTCSTQANSLTQVTNSHRGDGVFLLIENDKYTFNFTSARAACLARSVPMATVAQMQQAVDRGLETCKFGWVDGQVAVIPRQTSDKKCGNGKTGAVKWFAPPSTLFGAFCFKPTEPTRSYTTERGHDVSTSTLAATQTSTHATQTSTHATHLVRSTTRSFTSRASENMSYPQRTTPKTAHTSDPGLPPAQTPLEQHSTSTSSSTTTSPVSVSSSHTPAPVLQPSATSPSLGVLPTTLTVLGLILVVTAAGATCYYKKMFAYGSKRLQNEDVETEMWKPSDRETHSPHGAMEEGEEEEGEQEEADRKYSSDIRLCVDSAINS